MPLLRCWAFLSESTELKTTKAYLFRIATLVLRLILKIVGWLTGLFVG
jgi:hypothetical protein